MAMNNQDGASARSDNRRMTGNINIYICSEAFDKDLNECRSSNGVKFRLDDTKKPGILFTNVDESDLLRDNVNKDKRERTVVIGERNNEDLKILDNTKLDKKMSKREEKVRVKMEKKKSKGSDKSNTNNTWFSYFWRKNDSEEKGKTRIGDEDLCTCKKKLNKNKKKNKKDERKRHKTDGEKSIPSTKTHKMENKPKNRRKTHNDSNLKTQEKSSNKKQNDNVREIRKSSLLSEYQKDVSNKNEPEKYSSTNKTDKSFGNNSSANEQSYDSKKTNSKTKSSTHKVKFKNKPISLKNKRTEDENSFFTKFFNLFKSKPEVPKRKTKNKCNPGCTELKKTAKTSSSVQRRSKTKRKRYKSELAGKVKRSNSTEQDFSTSNQCHIQVNENDRKNKKIGVCLVNDSSDIKGTTSYYKKETHNLNEKYENEKNIKPNKLLNSQDSKELIKKNRKETNIKDHKPISTQTNQINTNSENSLQLCFSCLFPSSDCLCRRNFPNHRCDCKKIITFDINKSTNDKRPHVSEVLPYQKSRNFPKVVNKIQGKIDESTNTKHTQNLKYTCTCEECCIQNDHTDKKLRAKCYCKNLPCRCCVIEARRCAPKQ